RRRNQRRRDNLQLADPASMLEGLRDIGRSAGYVISRDPDPRSQLMGVPDLVMRRVSADDGVVEFQRTVEIAEPEEALREDRREPRHLAPISQALGATQCAFDQLCGALDVAVVVGERDAEVVYGTPRHLRQIQSVRDLETLFQLRDASGIARVRPSAANGDKGV